MSVKIKQALLAYFESYPIDNNQTIAVAVSGGADSLCLALCLKDIADKKRITVVALTVNHGLRPEAAAEADWVKNVMLNAGISHETLVWTGKKPKVRVEEKARQKRYELLENWCRKNGVGYLFLAHHQGDQAETFWARLARGSGITGLSAMSQLRSENGVALCRPFLNLDKSVLEQELVTRKIGWVSDSMNQDEFYERVRWRNRQSVLSEMGLTVDKIGLTTSRLARAKNALDFYANRFMEALVDVMPEGYVMIQEQALLSVPAEIRLRVVKQLVQQIGGMVDVALDSLEQWLADFPLRATLGRCVLVRQKGVLFIAREVGRGQKVKIINAGQTDFIGGFLIQSNCPSEIRFGDTTGYPELPALIRQAIPRVVRPEKVRVTFGLWDQKRLEKPIEIDYKKKKENSVFIQWIVKDKK